MKQAEQAQEEQKAVINSELDDTKRIIILAPPAGMPGMGPDPRDRRVKLFGELNEELANLAKNAEEIVPKKPAGCFM